MRPIFILCCLFLCFSCAISQLNYDLDDAQAYRLYKKTLKQNEGLELRYNEDSTYVVLVQSPSLHQGGPCSFLVLDLQDRSINFISINTYRDVQWKDAGSLQLKKNMGVVKPATDPAKPTQQNSYQVYDIKTKKLSEYQHTKTEKH